MQNAAPADHEGRLFSYVDFQLHLSAPPFPQSLDLDFHTKQFFFPDEHFAPIGTTFRLDTPAFKDRIFISRAALFCDERLHLVTREEANINAPVLVAMLPLPLQPSDRALWPTQIAGYFETHLTKPEKGQGKSSNGAEFVPTLQGLGTLNGLVRLHFDTTTGLGLTFHADGDANIVDLRDEAGAAKDNPPYIYIGDALLEADELENPMRAFIKMPDARFHERVAAMLRDSEGVLAASLRFHLMNEDERCAHVFGCTPQTLKVALEMLRLALVVEMSTGYSLEGFEQVEWHPWSLEELLDVQEGRQGAARFIDVPVSLKWWLATTCEKTGCQLSEDVQFRSGGASAIALEFAQALSVSAQRLSAHEAIEAVARLNEILNAR